MKSRISNRKNSISFSSQYRYRSVYSMSCIKSSKSNSNLKDLTINSVSKRIISKNISRMNYMVLYDASKNQCNVRDFF